MSQLENIAERRRQNGFNTSELLRDDSEWVACWACQRKHKLRPGNADHDYEDFAIRHPAEKGCVVLRLGPKQMEKIVRSAEKKRKTRLDSVMGFLHNSSCLEAFQASDQSFDLTGFNSLASSPTAGWCSSYIDNRANLYLDYLAAIGLSAVNTTPSANMLYYVYAASSFNTTNLPMNSSGHACTNSGSTSAVMTFPDISAGNNPVGFPNVALIPCVTQNAPAQTPLFATAPAFGGWIGLYLWYPFINYSGVGIAASGNSFIYRGVYTTVA